jgi:predicted glycoside hydrolase/deacetylase ChbG (UPF0249 family)
MRRLTLCADDFAQSPAISQGIVQLVQAGRLSATSIMSQSPHWPQQAPALRELSSKVQAGLHFNLTHPFDRSSRPLGHWLLRSQLRALPYRELHEQCLRQIDLFTAHYGQLPQFIDGHQHVHALPVVRDALWEAIAKRWSGAALPYLRAPDRLTGVTDDAVKGRVLRVLCRGFFRQSQQRGFALPQSFGGLYSLQPQADFASLIQRWLHELPDRSLIMCHPGLQAEDPDDPINASRAGEFRYLMSDAFIQHCTQAQVQLQGWSA